MYNDLFDDPTTQEQFYQGARQGQPKKKKNFFLDQISTIGGIAGGIGGSFIAPIAGTAAGAGAGSALGEALENLLTGEKWSKNVAKEGLLGGAFGAGPLKLAGAGVKTGAKLLGREVAEEVGEKVTRSASQRGAQKLLGNAWGIKSGAKIGAKQLSPQEASTLQKFIIKDIGVPKTANADMVFERVVNHSKTVGKQIGDTIKTSGRKLSPNEVNALASNLEGRFNGLLGANATNPIAQDILNGVRTSNGDPTKIWNLTKRVEKALRNYRRNPAGSDSLIDQIGTEASEELRKSISKIPGVKKLNSSYSQARQIEELVAPAAKNPRGINIMNNKIGGGIAQRVQSGLGQAQMGLEGKLTGMAGAPSAKGIATRQIGQNLLLPRGGMEQPQDLESALLNQSDLGANQTSNNMLNTNQIMDESYQDDPSPYSRKGLLLDIQRDPANMDKYLETYQMFQEIFNPQDEAPEFNSTEASTLTDLQNGLANIQQLGESYSTSNANMPVIGNLLASIPGNTGARNLRADTARVKQVIGKALEGGVLRKEDEEKYAKILPTLNDSDEEAQYKIEAIYNDLARKLSLFSQHAGGGSSLEDALLQRQTQGAYR